MGKLIVVDEDDLIAAIVAAVESEFRWNDSMVVEVRAPDVAKNVLCRLAQALSRKPEREHASEHVG